MARIIAIHSFRGGTGKSNTTANLAALLAAEGRRVGVIDTDIQSPGIHVLFGLGEDQIRHALNDYLWGKCAITETAHEVTTHLQGGVSGQIFLIPSSIKAGEITRVLREGYNVGRLNDGLRELVRALQLDILLIDTHPGLNEETLLAIAISHALVIILRPDQQDYQGTGVTIEVARQLDVPRLLLVVNKVPAPLDLAEVKARIETTYNAEVAAVLPHSDELMLLGSASIFALQYPQHPVTLAYQQLAAKLMEG
jgi:septum site-determining protein MinD